MNHYKGSRKTSFMFLINIAENHSIKSIAFIRLFESKTLKKKLSLKSKINIQFHSLDLLIGLLESSYDHETYSTKMFVKKHSLEDNLEVE